MVRLRRVDCSAPGIRRRRRGRGFEYLRDDGGTVAAEDIARVRALAIPPAWKDVWICVTPNGHLQATGTDAAGRKQYLYHEHWRLKRDRAKFDEMLEFARCLPQISRVCEANIAGEGLGKERVLSCATRLLYRGFFRIGSEGYAEQNQTYGLATIKKSHVRVTGELITFRYTAKGGKERELTLPDPLVAPVVAALKRRRAGSEELLAYRDGRGWNDVRSADINDYIKEITGKDFSAKDFRTWSATVLAAIGAAVSAQAVHSPTAQRRAISHTIKDVAGHLDNTPAVCRSSYIDPRVFDRYLSGWTISPDLVYEAVDLSTLFTDEPLIHAVVDLLEDNRGSEGLERIA